jgi:hypothetical protein
LQIYQKDDFEDHFSQCRNSNRAIEDEEIKDISKKLKEHYYKELGLFLEIPETKLNNWEKLGYVDGYRAIDRMLFYWAQVQDEVS